MDELPTIEAPSPLGRRELIRKGALAGGGLVWGLPLIRTVNVIAATGSQPPGTGCCTCNCSGDVGRVVVQGCRPDLNTSGDCEASCLSFCEQQGLFSEAVGFTDCGANPSTCQPTTLLGATGTACACASGCRAPSKPTLTWVLDEDLHAFHWFIDYDLISDANLDHCGRIPNITAPCSICELQVSFAGGPFGPPSPSEGILGPPNDCPNIFEVSVGPFFNPVCGRGRVGVFCTEDQDGPIWSEWSDPVCVDTGCEPFFCD